MTRLLLFAAFFFVGCDFFGIDRWDREGDRLLAHRARWEDREPIRYDYSFRRGCFLCPGERNGPVRIGVAGGRLSAAIYLEDIHHPFDPDSVIPAGTLVPGDYLDAFGPIESVFEEVERAIDARHELIEVEYDARLGYPASALLSSCLDCLDGGVLLTVSDLTALP